MISLGLFILGIIQIVTGISMFLSAYKDEMFGVKTLKGSLSLYRYMLTSLWISVGIIYLAGAFINIFTIAALSLGVMNVVFEIIGYWTGFMGNKKYWWYPYAGTLVMGIPGVLCIIKLLSFNSF
ncbi:MAG: hypothetical protein AB6733_10585 [Clostridiaceae bacterium]